MPIQVIPAKLQMIQNQQSTVYVSTANESINGSMMRIAKASHQQISEATPILTGSGQTIQWGFYLPEGSMINTPNSYLNYKVRFAFNTKTLDIKDGSPQTVVSDPETLSFLTPGRYTILDNGLFCEPAILDGNGSTFSKFGPGKYICLFPMNSAVILDSTRVSYGNVQKLDENVSHHRTILQANLAEEYQAMHPQTYFEQNIDPSARFIVYDQGTTPSREADGTIKYTAKAANTPAVQTFWKTFQIPLNLVNTLFDIKGRFYEFAFSKAKIQLEIKLMPYSLSKLFFTEKITDQTQTGITEMELYLYIKQSSVMQSDMNDKGQFGERYINYNRDTLTLNGGISGISNPTLPIGHKSSNDVYACLGLPDVNSFDSTYLKQRYTLFNSTQQTRIMNREYGDDIFVFFNQFNVYRGNSQQRYFVEDINDAEMLRRETMRSYNMLQQYSESLSPSFNTMMKQMLKYAMMRVNLEAFKQESLSDGDVIYDGYNSELNRLMLKISLKVYNLSRNSIDAYNLTINQNPELAQIANGLVNLYAYQTFDEVMGVNPQTGIMKISEDIGDM